MQMRKEQEWLSNVGRSYNPLQLPGLSPPDDARGGLAMIGVIGFINPSSPKFRVQHRRAFVEFTTTATATVTCR
jgi:hypothetical protein